MTGEKGVPLGVAKHDNEAPGAENCPRAAAARSIRRASGNEQIPENGGESRSALCPDPLAFLCVLDHGRDDAGDGKILQATSSLITA